MKFIKYKKEIPTEKIIKNTKLFLIKVGFFTNNRSLDELKTLYVLLEIHEHK